MMDLISQEMVDAAMNEVANTPPDDVEYLTDQMLAEQPAILEYLYRLDDLPIAFADEADLDETERNYIIYIGLVVWKAIRDSPRPMRCVTWEALYAVIDEMEVAAYDLAAHPDRVQDAALLLIENHPEPEMLRFIVDAMRPREDDPTFPPIRPMHQTGVRMLFQIILTAMLRSAKG